LRETRERRTKIGEFPRLEGGSGFDPPAAAGWTDAKELIFEVGAGGRGDAAKAGALCFTTAPQFGLRGVRPRGGTSIQRGWSNLGLQGASFSCWRLFPQRDFGSAGGRPGGVPPPVRRQGRAFMMRPRGGIRPKGGMEIKKKTPTPAPNGKPRFQFGCIVLPHRGSFGGGAAEGGRGSPPTPGPTSFRPNGPASCLGPSGGSRNRDSPVFPGWGGGTAPGNKNPEKNLQNNICIDIFLMVFFLLKDTGRPTGPKNGLRNV